MGKGSEGLTFWHKIAVLVEALGEESAGQLMRHFDEEDVAQVAKAVADLKNVSPELQNSVLLEFEGVLQEGASVGGGVDFARGLLERALGPDKAAEMLGRATGGATSGFKMLSDADPAQVAPFIAQEHPQTAALILSQAEAPQAAAILEQLSAAQQAEVVHRIATLGHVAPHVLDEVEQTLGAILKDAMGCKREVGGSQVVADILNLVGSRLEKNVLERIDNADPEVAEQIRKQMFVFADLAILTDADMQMVMRHIEIKDLQVALKAACKAVRDRFFSALSERARARLIEDMDALPPMRLSEVEEVQRRIVQQVRQLKEQQVISIPRNGDADQFV